MNSIFARPRMAAFVIALNFANGLIAAPVSAVIGPALAIVAVAIWFSSEWLADR